MGLAIILGFGIACCIAGYAFYGLALRRELVQPSRASWLIWSATTGLEALTYQAVNEGALQNVYFFVSTICCLLVTLAIWRHSAWQRPSITDSICMAICLASMILWFGYDNAWWAHLLALIAIPVSFVPTWLNIRESVTHERSPSWGLWSIGDATVLIAIGMVSRNAGTELPYAILELVCHAATWIMVGLPSIHPLRSFRLMKRGIGAIAVDERSGHTFLVSRNRKGKAVHAAHAIAAGGHVIEFTGPVYEKNELPRELDEVTDRFLQIEHNFFMGPSHGIDDLINHSCNPNCGLTFTRSGVHLIALRDIARGEELSWDYSTTSLDHGWSMQCLCKAANCRGLVGDFRLVPETTQWRYRRLGILPNYIIDLMDAGLNTSKPADADVEVPSLQQARR
jgi:SET domain